MMIWVSKVSVVQKPNISHISNFVVLSSEEFGEVFHRLYQVGKPDESWQVGVSSFQEFSSQLHFIVISLKLRLCIV